MPLKDRLIAIQPREISGNRVANRFEFQKSWALTHLIELHRRGADYAIVMDYHDDVLVLDSSNDPQKVSFYQVKTKETGVWTSSGLLKKRKGKDRELLSPLGKLVDHKIRFEDDVESLNFISNQAFRLTLSGGKSDVVQKLCLNELDKTELESILEKLKAEHSLKTHPKCADCTNFSTTKLSINGHPEHAMGILAEYLGEVYPDGKILLPTIYKALTDEIRRKSTCEDKPASFQELCSKRAIRRSDFEQFLKDVKPSTEMNERLALILSSLQSEDVGLDRLLEIQSSVRRIEIERMDLSDLLFQRARSIVRQAVSASKASQTVDSKLIDKLVTLMQTIKSLIGTLIRIKGENYVMALILMELYEL